MVPCCCPHFNPSDNVLGFVGWCTRLSLSPWCQICSAMGWKAPGSHLVWERTGWAAMQTMLAGTSPAPTGDTGFPAWGSCIPLLGYEMGSRVWRCTFGTKGWMPPASEWGSPGHQATLWGWDGTSACMSVLAPWCPWWGGLWQSCGLVSYIIAGAGTDGPGLG